MSAPSSSNVTRLRSPVPCPQCKRPSKSDFYPFCCKRCADLDLGAWLNGSYRIMQGEESSGEGRSDG